MIKNLGAEEYKLPCLGHIRLGIRKVSPGGAAYPTEIDYFILDPIEQGEVRQKVLDEFHALYGEKPKALDIMFPLAEKEQIFIEWYKRYSAGGLKCKGDGEVASCYKNEVGGMKVISERGDELVNIECRGSQCKWQQQEHPQCYRVGTLQVLLPEISGLGIWQLNTSSINSIRNIKAAIEWIRGALGEYRLLPLRLNRVPLWTVHSQRKSMHYVITISNDKKLSELQRISGQNIEKMNNKAALVEIELIEEESEIEVTMKEGLGGHTVTENLGDVEMVAPEMIMPKQKVNQPMPMPMPMPMPKQPDVPPDPPTELVNGENNATPAPQMELGAEPLQMPLPIPAEALDSQADPLQAPIAESTTLATRAQIRALYSILSQWGVKGDAEKHQRFNGWLKKHFNREVKSFNEITKKEVSAFIEYVSNWAKQHKGGTANG